jgi:predicted transcriptional regulator
VAHIKKGVRQADKGLVVAGQDVDRWLASWGTPKELPAPKPRRRSPK